MPSPTGMGTEVQSIGTRVCLANGANSTHITALASISRVHPTPKVDVNPIVAVRVIDIKEVACILYNEGMESVGNSIVTVYNRDSS